MTSMHLRGISSLILYYRSMLCLSLNIVSASVSLDMRGFVGGSGNYSVWCDLVSNITLYRSLLVAVQQLSLDGKTRVGLRTV